MGNAINKTCCYQQKCRFLKLYVWCLRESVLDYLKQERFLEKGEQ